MNWFLASLIAPLIWSLVNHVDKIILSRYFHGGGSGGLMIFVGVIALPIAAVIAYLDPSALSIGTQDAITLIASGIFYNVAIYYYLKALEKHDASYVVPFWQLAPVCGYFFGIIFLNEYLSGDKLLGGVVVIAGALLLSASIQKRRISLDFRTIGIMIVSSATIALGYVLFKDVDDSMSFMTAMFWNQIGMTIFGIGFYLLPAFRKEFHDVIKQNSGGVLGLNLVEQIFEIAGVAAANYAVLLAPAALVVLVEYSAQPLFVFLFGILFTFLLPSLVKEDMSRKTLIQKFTAIVVMAVGLSYIV